MYVTGAENIRAPQLYSKYTHTQNTYTQLRVYTCVCTYETQTALFVVRMEIPGMHCYECQRHLRKVVKSLVLNMCVIKRYL